jgi:hypothetical protein
MHARKEQHFTTYASDSTASLSTISFLLATRASLSSVFRYQIFPYILIKYRYSILCTLCSIVPARPFHIVLTAQKCLAFSFLEDRNYNDG